MFRCYRPTQPPFRGGPEAYRRELGVDAVVEGAVARHGDAGLCCKLLRWTEVSRDFALGQTSSQLKGERFPDERYGFAERRGIETERLCCIISLDAVCLLLYRSGCDSEDFEQLVDEAYLVLDTRLAGKTMSSPDHPHHFESFDRGRGFLHRLKASRRANDSLEGTVISFDDVVQVFVRAMLCRV
jgi:hypothetical protein